MQYPKNHAAATAALKEMAAYWLTITSPSEARQEWYAMESIAYRFGILLSDFFVLKPDIITTTTPDTHTEPAFKCAICNRTFKSQAALSGHGTNRCQTNRPKPI